MCVWNSSLMYNKTMDIEILTSNVNYWLFNYFEEYIFKSLWMDVVNSLKMGLFEYIEKKPCF